MGYILWWAMKKITQKMIPYVLFIVYGLLRLTWRIKIHEHENFKKLMTENKMFVPGHWHGEELGLLYMLKHYHVACMVSLSSDGEIMAKVIDLFGSRTVRGSSSRGGVGALKGILKLAKEGWRPSFAVDGPKGPRHVVKPGIIEIAKILKAPIIPVTMASSNPFVFERSWNKAELPKPFSKVHVLWGDPIYVENVENPVETMPAVVAEKLQEGRKFCLESLNS